MLRRLSGIDGGGRQRLFHWCCWHGGIRHGIRGPATKHLGHGPFTQHRLHLPWSLRSVVIWRADSSRGHETEFPPARSSVDGHRRSRPYHYWHPLRQARCRTNGPYRGRLLLSSRVPVRSVGRRHRKGYPAELTQPRAIKQPPALKRLGPSSRVLGGREAFQRVEEIFVYELPVLGDATDHLVVLHLVFGAAGGR